VSLMICLAYTRAEIWCFITLHCMYISLLPTPDLFGALDTCTLRETDVR